MNGIKVAVVVDQIPYSYNETKKCCKKSTFFIFHMFWKIFWISSQIKCYSATSLKKTIDFKRYQEIFKIISSSSSGSSPVAVGSSRVAVGQYRKWTATGKYNLKLISYKKVAVVAVDFIQEQKIWFLPFFCSFLTVKKASVAVDFSQYIYLNQQLIIDKNCNCYSVKLYLRSEIFNGAGLSGSRIFSPFNCQKNRLLLLIYYLLIIGFMVLMVKGLRDSVLVLGWGERGTWRFFGEKKRNGSGIFTAHNYKKCDRQVLDTNKINELQIVDIKKSVVQFGTGECLSGVLRSGTHPPIENSDTLTQPSYLLLSINCKDFQRVFYKSICQGFDQIGVFGFQKVGGAGGVR